MVHFQYRSKHFQFPIRLGPISNFRLGISNLWRRVFVQRYWKSHVLRELYALQGYFRAFCVNQVISLHDG